MVGTLDDTAGTTSRQLMSGAVLQNAPALSNWNGESGNSTSVDLGQRGHSLNASGYGSWPYIQAFEFSSTMAVEYGGDAINVDFGNTADESSISIQNGNPSDETHVYLTISDPALNIDPTTADKWRFNIAADPTVGGTSTLYGHQLYFANNETDDKIELDNR
jgi:hypothetical protein